ncbi:MAG: carboxypeptidase-like regulatory domain-containing protein [Aridibacter sp.]
MRKIQFQILAVAILSLFLSSCFLPTSITTVSGRVTKGDTEPIASAEVSFGGVGFEETTTTDADGKFTVTAKHKPMQMLRLEVKKKAFAMREKVEFPGFAAPDEPIEIELLKTVRY